MSPLSSPALCFTNSVACHPGAIHIIQTTRGPLSSHQIGYVFLICQWLRRSKTSSWLSNERLKNINMAEWDKKARAIFSPAVYHTLLHIRAICMVQILGPKREIRIPFSAEWPVRGWNIDCYTEPMHPD